MGINERKERQKLELRRKILAEAESILLTKGWSQLSIRNIASAIEYSPATIYLYFDSKDEIGYELMEKGFKQLTATMRPYFEEADLIKRLKNIGVAFIQFGLTQKEWFDIMFHPSGINFTKYLGESSPGLQLFGQLEATCQELQKEYPQIKDARIFAINLLSQVVGLVSLIQCDHIGFLVKMDSETLAHQAMQGMIDGLFGAPSE